MNNITTLWSREHNCSSIFKMKEWLQPFIVSAFLTPSSSLSLPLLASFFMNMTIHNSAMGYFSKCFDPFCNGHLNAYIAIDLWLPRSSQSSLGQNPWTCPVYKLFPICLHSEIIISPNILIFGVSLLFLRKFMDLIYIYEQIHWHDLLNIPQVH